MDFRYFVSQVAHPFVLYVLFGTLVSYLLIKLLLRSNKFSDARSRLYLLFIPLLLPLAAFTALQLIYEKQCITGINYSHQTFNMVNQWLCSTGTFLATYLTPLFIVTGFLASIKAVISVAACRRLIYSYGYANEERFPELLAILRRLSDRAELNMPRVVVTPDLFARSFTFGFRNPVIVISRGLIENLDAEELEGVLAHELAHIIRSDSVLNWLTVFLRDMMFFTPVMFWLFRDLSREKEHATDDIAVILSEKPMALAGALIKVWRLSPKNRWNYLAFDNFNPYPQFAGGEGVLEGRVLRIVERERYAGEGLAKVLLPGAIITITSFVVLYFVC